MENIKNVVPSYYTIEEGALSLIAESERSFTEMMKEIGISELHSFEESGVILEADNVDSTIDRIIEWFKQAFKDFKEYLDKALNKLRDQISKSKQTILPQNKIEEAVKNLKDDKEYGKTYEYKELGWARNTDSGAEQSHWKAIKDFRADVKKAYDTNDENIKNIVEDGKKKLDERFGVTDTNRISAIKKFLRGDEVKVTKAYLTDGRRWNIIRETAIDYGHVVSKMKKDYNTLKKETDAIIANIKEAQKKLKKGDKQGFNDYINGFKATQSYMREFSSATIACISEQIRFSVMLCLRLSLAWKKKEEADKKAEEKAEVKQESAIHSTKFETELSTLFDF